MMYSELANWDGSLDLQRQRDRDAYKEESTAEATYVIPQWQIDEFIAADDCAEGDRLVCDSVEDGSGMEVVADVNGGEWGQGCGHGFGALVREASISASDLSDMESVARVRVRRKARRRSVEQHMLPEIVISPFRNPTPTLRVRSPGPPPEERDVVARRRHPPDGPAQNAIRTKSGAPKRTYAGPRRKKEASVPAALTNASSSSAGPSRIGHRSSALTRESGRYIDKSLEADNSIDSKGGSPNVSSCQPITAYSASSSSSRPRSNGEPSRSPVITPPDSKRRNDYSRNPVYSSLSEIINGARQHTLEHQAALLEKPGRLQTPSSSSNVPRSRHDAQCPKPAANRPPRNIFDCVLVPPPRRPFLRDTYKPMRYYFTKEVEAESLAKAKRPKGKERERERSVSIGVKSVGARGIKRGPPKRNQKEKEKQPEEEVIYVSSSTEAPSIGPSKSAPVRRTYGSGDAIRRRSKIIQPIVIDPSSEDECHPPDRDSPRRPPMKDSIVIRSKPIPTAKRMSKGRKKDVILSSDDSSAKSVSEMIVVESANKPLSPSGPRPGSLLLDVLQTPPRRSERSGKERRTEIGVDKGVLIAEEHGGEGATMEAEGGADAVSSSPSKNSSTPTFHLPMATLPPPLDSTVVVGRNKPSAYPSYDHSAEARSPTLRLSTAPSRLRSPSPSSRSTTLAVREETLAECASDASEEMETNLKTKSRGADMNEKEKEKLLGEVLKPKVAREMSGEAVDAQEDSGSESDSESESSSDEEDDVCHRCRSRNIYAKMKCTNIKEKGVCPLHYCHRCIAVYFPKIEFDPYSPTFVCPSCKATCDCIGCCRKRGEPERPPQRTRKWNELGVELLLSQQETRRRERAEMRRAAGLPERPKKTKPRKRFRNTNVKANRAADIGEEAEDWLRRQRAGNRKIRAFVGAWQDSWGPTPFCVHGMDSVDFDVHAIDGRGKGKGKDIDPGVRLYVGDERALHRPFLRAEEVTIRVPVHQPYPQPEASSSSQTQKKRPGRKRKKVAAGIEDVIFVKPASEVPERKKRRPQKSLTIPTPEITMDQDQDQTDGVSSSATSPFYYPTPDDYSPFHGLPGSTSTANPDAYGYPYGYPGIANDPINGPFGADVFGMGGEGVCGYEPDWDSLGTGLDADKKDVGQEADFSYQGTYDSYAAALGEGTGLVDTNKDLMPLIDPTLLDPDNTPKPSQQSPSITPGPYDPNTNSVPAPSPDSMPDPDPTPLSDSDSDEDPSRYLTPHANVQSTLMSVPMIYGVPSSTGLSLHELQKTVSESLSALTSPAL